MSDLGILADDLTGACDAAASFALRVGAVPVFLDPRRGPARCETVPAVLNTQSRLLSPKRSRLRVRKVARSLRGRPVIYKKTDSVLRGPAGAELQALARLFPRHSISVIPSIPDMGKTMRNGLLFEHGIPAHLTAYGRDPFSPLRTNDVRQIILATGRIDFEAVDAETSEDIAHALERALAKGKVILAGSLGLADELARMVKPGTGLSPARSAPRRTLVLCGSLYPLAREQMSTASSAFGVQVTTMGGNRGEREVIHDCRGKNIVFLQIDTQGARRSLFSLFRQARRIIRTFNPEAVGIIGGETAYQILRLLRTTRLEVEGREQPGLPYGVIKDGELRGCAFATKGGSVGTPDACIRMVTCMAHRGKDPS